MIGKRTLLIGCLALIPMSLGLAYSPKFPKTDGTTLESRANSEITEAPPLLGSCDLGGVTVTAINTTQALLIDKFEVGWDYAVPAQLASLGSCSEIVEGFFVHVQIVFKNGGFRSKTEDASPLARNATVRFDSGLRDIKKVTVLVTPKYKFSGKSGQLSKDL